MKEYRIESVTPLPDDRSLRVRWTDGLEGVIDFADLMERPLFRPLRNPQRFRDVRVYEYGHSLYWLDDDGSEIDICPDVLRARVDPEVARWIAEQERRWAATQAAE
jgi:hypothetical protein